MTNINIFFIIVGKFDNTLELCLVILFIIYVYLKMSLHDVICSLNLIICFWTKSGVEFLFTIQEIIEEEPKFRAENWPWLTDNVIWQAIKSYHYIHDNLCKSYNINFRFNRFIVDYLCEIIYNH